MKKTLLFLFVSALTGYSFGQCTLGNDTDLGETSSHSANYLLGSAIDVASSLNLTHLGMIAIDAGDNFQVAVYDDNGGNPGNLITSGSGTTVAGVNEIDVPDVVLAPGTYYYMAVFETSASVSYTTTTSATVWYISFAYGGALPDPFGAPTTYTGQEFGYYFINKPDVTTSLAGATITANNANADSYQWIYCASGLDVAGETNQSFTATVNGSYACIVNQGGCEDTTECVVIDFIGLEEQELNRLSVTPNPSNGKFNVSFAQAKNTELSVTDLNGRLLFNEEYFNVSETELDLSLPTGVYLLTVLRDGHKATQRLVIE